MLKFLPGSLQSRLFTEINICDNNFKGSVIIPTNPYIYKNEVRNPTLKSLSDLSFGSIIKNRVQLSSQYLPIGLQNNYFHCFSHCRHCREIVYSYNTNETFEYARIKTLNTKGHNSAMAWQYFQCCFTCKRKYNRLSFFPRRC